MESRIAKALRLRHPPVGLVLSDEKPEGAVQFRAGHWGCLMWLLAAAAEGRTAACDRNTFGCIGGGVGFGFGDRYRDFPGGVECFCRFLSTGNEASAEGRAVAEQLRPHMRPEAHEDFLRGERYLKDPAAAARFAANLPVTEVPTRYVLLEPLGRIDPERERPEVVVFLADANQLSALVVLANYESEDNHNVIVPFAAGCQAIGIYPLREGRSDRPRGVVGLVDLSARLQLKKRLGDDLLSFAAPYALFRRMEDNVEGSFLERPTWQALAGGGEA